MSNKNFEVRNGVTVKGDDISKFNGKFALKVPSGNDTDAGTSYNPDNQKPSSSESGTPETIRLEAGMVRYNTDTHRHEQSVDDGLGNVVWVDARPIYHSETFILIKDQNIIILANNIDSGQRNYSIEYNGVPQDEYNWQPVDGSNVLMTSGFTNRIKLPEPAFLDGDVVVITSSDIRAVDTGVDNILNSLNKQIHTVYTLDDLRGTLVDESVPNQAYQVLGRNIVGDGEGGPLRYWSSGKAVGYYVDNDSGIIVPDGGDGSAAWIIMNTDLANMYIEAVNDIITQAEADTTLALRNYRAFNPTGSWVTATDYELKDIYTDGNIAYLVVEDHTSTSIVADLAAGYVVVYQGYDELLPGIQSNIKGVWYPSNSGVIVDHGAASGSDYDKGNLKSIVDSIGTGEATIEIPPGTYNFPTKLVVPKNITLKFNQGVLFDTGEIEINGGVDVGIYNAFGNTLVLTGNYIYINVPQIHDIERLRGGGGNPNQIVYVTGRNEPGDGYDGHFMWVSGDLSIKVSADPQSGIVVALNSDVAGENGAWVRLYNGININPGWFGAVGENSVIDTAAFLGMRSFGQTKTGKIIIDFPVGIEYFIADPTWMQGMQHLIVNGNGSSIKNTAVSNYAKMLMYPVFGLRWPVGGIGISGWSNTPKFSLIGCNKGDTSVFTATPADAGQLPLNNMIMIASWDIQVSNSIPPNMRYYEWHNIVSVDYSTGEVVLDQPLEFDHRDDIPYYIHNDGRATIYNTSSVTDFNINQTWNDLEFIKNDIDSSGAVSEAIYCTGKNIIFNRCKGEFLPSVAESIELVDCICTDSFEVDKLIKKLKIEGGVVENVMGQATGAGEIEIINATLNAGWYIGPRVLTLRGVRNYGSVSKILSAYSAQTDILRVIGGTTSEIPNANAGLSTYRQVVVGSEGVSWNETSSILSLTFAGVYLDPSNFMACCRPETIVQVAIIGGGTPYPSGNWGVVKSITGGLGVAEIEIQFNAPLVGNETLFISNIPMVVEIDGVEHQGKYLNQTHLDATLSGKASKINLMLSPNEYIWSKTPTRGRLKSMAVEVLRPYTGLSSNATLLFITSYPTYGSPLNHTIDLKTTGIRYLDISTAVGWVDTGGESSSPSLLPVGSMVSSGTLGVISVNSSNMVIDVDSEQPIISVYLEFFE